MRLNKIVNFADVTAIVLRDICCLNRKQVKKNFSKAKPYRLEHIKIELINQDKRNGYNFPLKYLELILITLSSMTPILTK